MKTPMLALLGLCLLAPGATGQPAAVPPSAPTAPAMQDDLAVHDTLRRFGRAEPPAKGEGAVRLATYNVANLFDDTDDPALSGDHEDIHDTKPEAECRAVARAIRRLDADILCLQEVESLDALLAFRDAHLDAMGYDHAVSLDAGDERGIEQGVLSRFPLTDARNWPGKALGGVHPEKYGDRENWLAGQPLVFHRSPLVVEVTVPAGARGNAEPYELTLVVVHHKSSEHSAYWREAETRGVLAELGGLRASEPDRNLVVLGDFNAQPSDASVKAYLGAGFADAFTLRAGSASEGSPSQGAPSVSDGPSSADPSTITHESRRRIDLILVNPALASEVIPGSAFVLGTPARPEGVDWRAVPTFEGYASDHYPVAIDLTPVEAPAAARD